MINARHILRRFNHDRRGVVALIFALSILPLTMLVGLSIDYSFYAQAQAQFKLAGDAAATYAIREATATYALESQANSANSGAYPNLTTDATTAGHNAGNNWFATQLATLPTSTVLGGEATADTAGLKTVVNATSCTGQTGGFNATVTYNGVYPPFFDYLFGSRKNWYVSGTSVACTSYSYDEVLLLLDTSGSMLIGANQSDIDALNKNDVCIPNAEIASDLVGGYPFGEGPPGYSVSSSDVYTTNPAYYPYDSRDNVDWNLVTNYTISPLQYIGGNKFVQDGGKNYNPKGSCASTAYNSGGPIFSPCAFACHSNPITANASSYFLVNGNKVPADLYGVARSLNPNQTTSANGGVTLRIDAVFNATENVIEDMQDSEQVYGQYTVGVYQFNDSTSPIVYGNGAGDPTQEATENLATALSTVQGDDWMKTPSETAVPIVASSVTGVENADFTDFASAMTELRTGKLTTGAPGSSPVNTNTTSIPYGNQAILGLANNQKTLTALAAAGNGTSVTSPLKVLIIVTDGLNDSNPGYTTALTSVDRLTGPMTSVLDELRAGSGAQCQLYKNLGFTIYVLYVTYYPIPSPTYYSDYQTAASTPYVATDYTPAAALTHAYASYSGGNTQEYVEGPTTVAATTNAYNYYIQTYPTVNNPNSNFSAAPDQAALQACAGSSTSLPANYAKYFYPATNAADISTAMNSILSSAINGAIRISQ
jgi:Flp pilus assembly protein TadG